MIFNYAAFHLKQKTDCYLLLWTISIVAESHTYYFHIKEFNIPLI